MKRRLSGLLDALLPFARKPGGFVEGYREHCAPGPLKRALLAYLPEQLLLAPEKRDRVAFSNLGIAQAIPRALNEIGYAVDIVSCYDQAWSPARDYDLFVGHGGINFERISRALPAGAAQIYFSTGLYWREANALEAERLRKLSQRRGVLLQPDRVVRYSEDYANERADGIICLGNENAVRSYSKFPRVIGINNAVYPVDAARMSAKDFAAGREHFLFFSGRGSVHKGLDLLLEAFAGTRLHLHVCQVIDEAFAAVYRRELTQEPNIHVHGHIPMRAPQFEALASRCVWTISATAAEGQPGGVLECMAHGLVPVLSPGANIGLEDFGIALADDDPAAIRASALAAADLPVEECARRAQRCAQSVRERYTPERFVAAFKSAVLQILAGAGKTARA